MSLVDVAISALLQAIVLGVVPLLCYVIFQKLRHKRTFVESTRRAGLQLGEPRYLGYAVILAFVGNLIIVVAAGWLSLEPFTRQGAAQRPFVGLGLGMPAIGLAFLNGLVQTGFPEELLFRGLIAGTLSRRLSLFWADLSQAGIFLMPHLLILLVMPELWFILPIVFLGALTFGWIRIKSGSIFGPTLMHASGNMTMALMVAIQTGFRALATVVHGLPPIAASAVAMSPDVSLTKDSMTEVAERITPRTGDGSCRLRGTGASAMGQGRCCLARRAGGARSRQSCPDRMDDLRLF